MNESIYFFIIATKICQSLSPNQTKEMRDLLFYFILYLGERKGAKLGKKFMLFECVSNYVHIYFQIFITMSHQQKKTNK
jgi:hypothetical protein